MSSVKPSAVGRVLLGIALLVALTASSASTALGKVMAHAAKERSVWMYKTYSWAPTRIVSGNDVVDDDPLFSPLIRKAVNAELQSRGFTEIKEGGEMTVFTAGLVTKSAQLEGFLMMWGMNWWWGYYPTAVQTVQRENERGLLFINLIETGSEKPIWGGYATDALPRKGAEYKTVNKATGKLFKKFPKNKLQ
jgi:uncharacterized protein DUF4136